MLEPVLTFFPLKKKLPALGLLVEAVQLRLGDAATIAYCRQQAFLVQRMVSKVRPALHVTSHTCVTFGNVLFPTSSLQSMCFMHTASRAFTHPWLPRAGVWRDALPRASLQPSTS